ncbi:MAG: DUF4831 family protein [Paludibacteraceae bacterium]|nr:DUF4831 family protein [Paludibacteraceae bacterium]
MKRPLLFLMAIFALNSLSAQLRLNISQPAIYYFLPATQLVFQIEYTETVAKRGVFYQYAERYLGNKAQINEDSRSMSISRINVTYTSKADTSRIFYLNEKQCEGLAICTDANHVIKSVNEQVENIQTENIPIVTFTADNTQVQDIILPLLEEQMLANSKSKMAEGTAKMIYRIREARLALLSGDAEQMPADGLAMQLTLQELDRQEKQLTALFIGSTQTTTHTATIVYTPKQSCRNEVLFRFSEHHGLLDADNLAGEPYYLTLNAEYAKPAAPAIKQSKAHHLFYIVPGNCSFQLHTLQQQLLSASCKIAQFGFVAPLPDKNGSKHTIYNTITGEIVAIY